LIYRCRDFTYHFFPSYTGTSAPTGQLVEDPSICDPTTRTASFEDDEPVEGLQFLVPAARKRITDNVRLQLKELSRDTELLKKMGIKSAGGKRKKLTELARDPELIKKRGNTSAGSTCLPDDQYVFD
jgi:hypothetical protein